MHRDKDIILYPYFFYIIFFLIFSFTLILSMY
nr:MAG TPA_asm: hypothetical protein [Caudoviricetes sp.]DAV95110.1 MAG TPA: hypothetical protein [Caudoviricetes sp.]